MGERARRRICGEGFAQDRFGAGFVAYGELTEADKREFTDLINALAEPLSQHLQCFDKTVRSFIQNDCPLFLFQTT